MQSQFMLRTRDLVAPIAEARQLSKLATEIDVPYTWLWRFSRGDDSANNAHYIERVYVHLSGKPLEL